MMKTAQDRLNSLSALNYITQAFSHNVGVTVQPRIKWCHLDVYESFAKLLAKRKTSKLVTLHAADSNYQTMFTPTKLGQSFFELSDDMSCNQYFNPGIPNCRMLPIVELLYAMFQRYNLVGVRFVSPALEHAFDYFMQDFKIKLKTREQRSKTTRWINSYKQMSSKYDRFCERNIYESNKMFEIYSITVKQVRFDQNTTIRAYGDGFQDYTDTDILNEISQPLIKAVWKNRNNNHVFSILAKWEMHLDGTLTKRLIFFVKKDDTNFVPFNETILCQDLQPFVGYSTTEQLDIRQLPFLDPTLVRALFHTYPEPIAPLNFYDLDQSLIGSKLNQLKMYLVGTDYWLRPFGESSLKYEYTEFAF
ncbi:hypothetical protein [Acinetobacter towneri]|uniref:hypothetical protein n=1 Tax=Acinetobacter towneri TaxID=202956 RepID=UPI0002CFEAF3|nr:hypothetical protein [Acinetobacter towneri]ENV70698.1 hypothetical protein F947_00704 [Acinetobacter towneri DSM 14962 = CIP 107472]